MVLGLSSSGWKASWRSCAVQCCHQCMWDALAIGWAAWFWYPEMSFCLWCLQLSLPHVWCSCLETMCYMHAPTWNGRTCFLGTRGSMHLRYCQQISIQSSIALGASCCFWSSQKSSNMGLFAQTNLQEQYVLQMRASFFVIQILRYCHDNYHSPLEQHSVCVCVLCFLLPCCLISM